MKNEFKLDHLLKYKLKKLNDDDKVNVLILCQEDFIDYIKSPHLTDVKRKLARKYTATVTRKFIYTLIESPNIYFIG